MHLFSFDVEHRHVKILIENLKDLKLLQTHGSLVGEAYLLEMTSEQHRKRKYLLGTSKKLIRGSGDSSQLTEVELHRLHEEHLERSASSFNRSDVCPDLSVIYGAHGRNFSLNIRPSVTEKHFMSRSDEKNISTVSINSSTTRTAI